MAGGGGAGRRPGLRLRALNAGLRLLVRPRLGKVADPARARCEFALAASVIARPPPYVLSLPAAGGLWISCGRVNRSKAVLYLHGGAFVTGSPVTHRAMLARVSLLAGVPVFAPDYRLAPEHPFPAALGDAEAAWAHLHAVGYDPEDLVIGGDSAGGGLAFSLLARLLSEGIVPAGAFGFSPWVDLAGESPSVAANAARDPLLPAARLGEVAQMYLQGHDAHDPLASPVHAAFPGAPPVLLQHSTTEILRDDTLRLAERLRAGGGRVRVEAWEEAPHVWQFFDGRIPEARAAIRQAAAFVRERLGPQS